MASKARSTSANTLRDGHPRNGGRPRQTSGGPDSNEIRTIRPGARVPPVRFAVSWRSWLIFLLTIGVLVSATYVFVTYIVNVPLGLQPKIEDARQERAALGAQVEDLAERAPEHGTIPQLRDDLAASRAEFSRVEPALAAAEAEIQRLEEMISGMTPGEEGGDLRDAVAGLDRDVSDLRRRFSRLDSINATVATFGDRLTALERFTSYVNLPSDTRLSDYVVGVARRYGGSGNAGEGLARLRQDMNYEFKRVESDINQLDSRMGALPSGTIVAWSAPGRLPSGWVECNGRNGTPDLRNRFLYGASKASYVGHTGGGGGHGGGGEHWHHADTWRGETHANEKACIYVQGASHPGLNVYAFFAHESHDGGSSLPPYTTVRFIMKR